MYTLNAWVSMFFFFYTNHIFDKKISSLSWYALFKDLAKQVILFIPCFFKDIFILLLCTPNFELKICFFFLSVKINIIKSARGATHVHMMYTKRAHKTSF
jgi:hypothetical protein